MKKLLLSAVIGLASVNASASGIDTAVYYDDGTIITSLIAQLNFDYQSQSTVTDTNNNNTLDAGDTISSVGGVAIYNTNGGGVDLADFDEAALNSGVAPGTALDYNSVTSATPGSAFSGTGYGDEDWILSFALNDFVGTFNGASFDYTSGDVAVYGLYASGSDGDWDSLQELFTLSITSTVTTGTAVLYSSSVTNVVNDYFYTNHAGDSFQTTLSNPNDTVFINLAQNAFGSSFIGYTNGVAELGITNHDGSMTFQVPEPTSIAILGLGLLGFAGANRRKS